MKNTENKKAGLQIVIIGLAILFLMLHLLLRFTGVAVWDDAYIFFRYAAHLSAGEGFSWNPGEAPGYGATSVAWTFLLSICEKTGCSPAAILYSASLAIGILLLVLLWRSARHSRWLFPVLLIANAPAFAEHFSSGMDTASVMLYLLLFAFSAQRFRGSVLNAAIGGMAWLVRPELAAVCTGVLLIMAWQDRRQGVKVWVFPALALVITWACVALCQRSLGSALPLPFYSKTGAHADEGIRAMYRWEGWKQLGLFVLVNAPLFLIIFRKKKTAQQTLHWWLPAAALTLFYLLGVTQIMGYDQRFYYHVWPLWFMAALQASKDEKGFSQPLRWMLPAATVAGLLITAMQGKPVSAGARWGKFDMSSVYTLSGRSYNWPLLEEINALPTDLEVATTEIGLPGAWNTDRPVYDMGGLTDPDRLPVKELMQKIVSQKMPDVIWLPNPHYTSLQKELNGSDVFRRTYEVYPADTLDAIQGLALRKASPHFEMLHHQVADYIAAHR